MIFSDLSHDPGRQMLSRINAKYELPQYVRSATATEMSSRSGKFASVHYKGSSLPANTAAQTWYSYAVFAEQAADSKLSADRKEQIKSKLRKQAELLGITDDLDEIDRTNNNLRKISQFGGTKFPVRNEKEAQAALEFLRQEQQSPRITSVENRHELATKLSQYYPDDTTVQISLLRRGTYDGAKVAAAISAAPRIGRSGAFITRVAQTVSKLSGKDCQAFAKAAAQAIQPHLADNAKAAECYIALGPFEEAVTMPDGSVVKAAALRDSEAFMSAAKLSSASTWLVDPPLQKIAESLDYGEMQEIYGEIGFDGFLARKKQNLRGCTLCASR